MLVSFEEIAKRDLMGAGVSLTEKQWLTPLTQFRKPTYFLGRTATSASIAMEADESVDRVQSVVHVSSLISRAGLVLSNPASVSS